MVTVALDVECPTCEVKPFEFCIYADTPQNKKRGCVGQRIYRNGYPYYHNDRQYMQSHFNWLHINGSENRERLSIWLAEYGDIFSEFE